MCSRRSSWASQGIALCIAVLALATAASAITLEEAKAKGQVGERPDGYVGLVQPDCPPEVRQLVEQVNTKRTALYTQIAEEEGISVVVVAARSGERLVSQARPGEFVLMGTWQKK